MHLLKVFHAPCDGSEAQIGAAIRAIEEQVAAHGRPTHTSTPVLVGKTLLISVVFASTLAPEARSPTDDRRDGTEPTLPGNDLWIRKRVRQLEIELIRQAMRQANENMTVAARLLRISEHTLRRKIRDFRIEGTASQRS